MWRIQGKRPRPPYRRSPVKHEGRMPNWAGVVRRSGTFAPRQFGRVARSHAAVRSPTRLTGPSDTSKWCLGRRTSKSTWVSRCISAHLLARLSRTAAGFRLIAGADCLGQARLAAGLPSWSRIRPQLPARSGALGEGAGIRRMAAAQLGRWAHTTMSVSGSSPGAP